MPIYNEKLSDEQLAAAKFPYDRPAVVTASAGSGKTFTLAEKLTAILSDAELNVPADRIAVMTFTKNATKSLIEKITSAVSARLSDAKNNGDRELAGYLQKQTIRLRGACISTIDAFCIKLIRENPEAFDLPVSFSIMDETRKAELQTRAMKDALQIFYDKQHDVFSEDELNALFYTFDFEDDRELQKSVFAAAETLSTFADAEKYLSDTEELYSDPKRLKDFYLPIIMPLFGNFRTEIADKLALYDSVLSEIRSETDELPEKTDAQKRSKSELYDTIIPMTEEYISLDRERFEQLDEDLAKFIDSRSLADLEDALDRFRDSTRVFNARKFTFNKGKKLPARTLFTKVKNSLSDLSDRLVKFTLDTSPETLEYQRTAMMSFVKLLRTYRKCFSEIKLSRGAADFSDCELKLLEKLRSDEAFRESVSRRFDCVIIDEFQDSNDIQAEIFRLIAHGALFCVGDVKQSIYAFRGGNPKIMMELCSGKAGFEVLPMYTNFRSHKNVLETVNYAFSGLMSEKFGGVDYDRRVNGLVPARDYHDAENSEEIMSRFGSEIVFLSGGKIGDDEREMRSPRYVARRIKELHDDEGFFVFKDEKFVRPKYSDFAILMRNKTHLNAYRAALKELGISSAAPKNAAFLDSEEVLLIINYLKVLDDPLDDESMLKLMMSPIFRFTAEEMANIRLGLLGFEDKKSDAEFARAVRKEFAGYSLYSCARHCQANILAKNGSPSAKLSDFLDDIKKFRSYKDSHTVPRLLSHIYINTDVLSVAAASDDPAKRTANLYKLRDLAESFDSGEGGSLGDFLRCLDRTRENHNVSIEDASSPEEAENSVRIMTFHGSKGLEAPVCLLTELESVMSRADYSGTLIMSREHSLALKCTNIPKRRKTRSLPYIALERLVRERQCGEELRLLYVAMTRAQDKMIMVVDSKLDGWRERLDERQPERVFEGSIPFKWIVSSLMRYNPDPTQKEFSTEFFSIGEEEFINEAPPAPEQIEAVYDISESEVSSLAEKINFRYPYEADTRRQAKFSVTELAHRGKVIPVNLTLPDFVQGKTAADKGNAYHLCMEHLPLELLAGVTREAYPDAVRDAVAAMIAGGILTEDDAELIEPERIVEFLDSDLGQRIIKGEVHREVPFLTETDGADLGDRELGVIAVQGRVDLYFIENGEAVVVDYKTDNIMNLSRELPSYAKQVKIYSGAIREMTGYPVKEAFIWAFVEGKAVKVF